MKAVMKLDSEKLISAKRQATFRGLYQAGAFIRTTARRSIRRRKRPSPAGSPPSTQTGRLKDALAFFVDERRERVIIGASAKRVGPILGVHEQGLFFRGTKYDARPTMGPALLKARPRIPTYWRFRNV